MKEVKQTITKPRHICNGRFFKTAYEAMQHLESLGLGLEKIESMLNGKILIYHAKPSQ